jgi:hypothetical protein
MDKPDPERASHFLLVRELLAGLVEKMRRRDSARLS